MKIPAELLKKYSQGDCTDEEIARIQNWLSSMEDDAQLSDLEFGDSIENIRDRLQDSLAETTPNKAVVPLHKKVLKYAAAAVIVGTLGLIAHSLFNGNPNEIPNEMAQFQDFKRIETQRGEKKQVTLPDGTTVHLNYETELRIPTEFYGDERVVFLQGHAHFEVVKNPQKPFFIHTDNSMTQVLGTSFDVNTSRPDNATEVIVTSGKVAFSQKANTNNGVTLTVNDRAVLIADSTIEVHEVDAQKLTAWKDNRFIADAQSLDEIITVIRPWFNVRIEVKNPELLSRTYTFDYDNPSLDFLLDEMSLMGGFKYKLEAGKATIY